MSRARRQRDESSRRRTSDRPRSAEGDERLAFLLDRNIPVIGPEEMAPPPARDVRLLMGPDGSYRFVALAHGRPVSVLRVISRDGIRAVIAEVYTTPAQRRRGWARRLLEVARRQFREVRHSDDLSRAGAAWRESVRDADYRGRPVPFDFARATFNVRQGRPGAIEVLLDGIEEWFPRQYAEAIAEAKRFGPPWVVVFNGRIARNRFRRWEDPRSFALVSPLRTEHGRTIARIGVPLYSAVVWRPEEA